jgi:hypothetical protein
MKLAGLHYLHNTLRSSLDLVFLEHKPCEIDPARVKDPAVIETNLANLKEYVENIFQAITTSALHCPSLMCQMFHDLKELASTCFPGESPQDKCCNLHFENFVLEPNYNTFIGLSLCKCWQPFMWSSVS